MTRTRNGIGGLILALTLSACAGGMNPANPGDSPSNFETQSPSVEPPPAPPQDDAVSSIEIHQERYPLKDTHEKLVDNRGNGFEPLYGTRNVRAVLNGVVYRGGANNSYNKYGKRANNNPLPTIGLDNLCKEGFGTAVYLYTTNYASAPHAVDCRSNLSSAANHLDYKQLNATTTSGQTAIFNAVYKAITDPANHGPVYVHCWNGWHASGLISALILRQFCGMSGADAQAYWDLNTDGAPVDSTYTSIRERIRTFVPKSGYAISAAMKQKICPQ